MARRKSRKTRSRRSAKTFNLGGLAESALIANAVTTGFFNCGLNDFIFAKDGGGSANTIAGRTTITAREILAGVTGGVGGYGTSSTAKIAQIGGGYKNVSAGGSFGMTVKENLKENGAAMVGSLILIPAGFRVFNKLTSKPRSTLNKALKMSGLPMKV